MTKAAICGALLTFLSAGAKSQSPVVVSLEPASGRYEIADNELGLTLAGTIDAKITRSRSTAGRDAIGRYHERSFELDKLSPMRGAIRWYDSLPVVLFQVRYLAKTTSGITFPSLTQVPGGFTVFSYRDGTFAPPTFSAAQTATPWLLFNENADSFVISPASNFMTTRMTGDGKSTIGERVDERLREVPKGYEQDTLLVFGKGIGRSWDEWGSAMRAVYRRPVPANDANVILKDFGYWTDNGADYYYNYDPSLGYAATLLAVRDRYNQEGIPLGYMQLDSWWYDKTLDDPSGHTGSGSKNSKLAAGLWNRYGGTWEYRADKDLFPNGLGAFQQSLGLPLAVHSRWIDRKSPYHENYKISGVGAVNPAWWNDTAGYLASNGVVCYEQDWLDEIYLNSPEMAEADGVGDAFTGGMAEACKDRGLTMQYCMATPRFFLQGLKYPNLTTIRASGDRFEPGEWRHFLFVSQLAQAVGIWPWCDVFKSAETGNMILSVLSGGPVGTGDALGKEDKENILKAARPDGVIVKPDRAIVPTDQTYLSEATKDKNPFIASTVTLHWNLTTTYYFAFPRSKDQRTVRLQSGGPGKVYLWDFSRQSGRYVDSSLVTELEIGSQGYAYFALFPVTKSGVALLGDLGKFVPDGKQRIPMISETPDGVKVQVAFAKGEGAVRIDGIAPSKPTVQAIEGSVSDLQYDPSSGRFSVEVMPSKRQAVAQIVIDQSQ